MTLRKSKLKYTAVTGFFEHDTQPGPPFLATTLPGLGLIDRVYETDGKFDPQRQKAAWERFARYLDHLNRPGSRAVYKLLYAARHGQGYHNVMEAEIGTVLWESHWAKLVGNENMTWADARLTAVGIRQAEDMKAFWADAAVNLKLPLPYRHYASPLARCLETCERAFADLKLPCAAGEVPPFEPRVKELLRERLGIHTCDRRHTRSWIRTNFPQFSLEPGFAEEDELWCLDVRETPEEHADRVEAFLDDVFSHDVVPIISVTAHCGTFEVLCHLIGHPTVKSAPGSIVPFLIKAEAVLDEESVDGTASA
ncbi:phosphoglycerate mutase-like protein [Parathielavia appendiculata]|uniref:Phosphoglycerate mutase-like protein n=1 Tax=Parathielavia appendiculata TaxID=2587402 RepID=A0AAN6Z1M6_9PEZI|nr:phosphoglycerate mutase-like protein [Parathielavia appendiculata]